MSAPHTAAIILNWQTPELVLELLRSLPLGSNSGLRAIVVENGSGDGSLQTLEAALSSEAALAGAVELIASNENLGFAGGVNLGVKKALEDPAIQSVWLVNPDAEVPPGTFEELTAVLAESGSASVSPCVRDGRNRWYGEHCFPRAFWARKADYFLPKGTTRWWPSERYQGSCALIDAGVIRRLIARDGYFLDPGIFLYWDEWDCSLRMANAADSVASIAGNAWIEHRGGEILGPDPKARMRQYYSARNAVTVTRRNVPRWKFAPLLGVRIARDSLWFASLRVRGQHPNVGSYVRGTIDGLRGRSGRWDRHPA